MWKQIKEDLAFPNIEGLFLFYVQGNCLSTYNIVPSLSRFISWHDLIKTSCIHCLLVKGAGNHYRYDSQIYCGDIPWGGDEFIAKM